MGRPPTLWCPECPSRGREGVFQNLKTPGSGYCRQCRADKGREYYNARKEEYRQAQIARQEAAAEQYRDSRPYDWERIGPPEPEGPPPMADWVSDEDLQRLTSPQEG